MDARRELLVLLEERERRRFDMPAEKLFTDEGPNSRDNYRKHVEFFGLGRDHEVRAFMGANQVGKTQGGAFELYCHATGRYPPWWRGRTFNRAIHAWMASETPETIKEGLQTKLLGRQDNEGSGLIPRDVLARCEIHRMPNTDGCLGSLVIPHVSGGKSRIVVKTYAQGREKFQAAGIDVGLLDEEPSDMGIFTETYTRTATTGGIMMLCFTALKGLTPLVLTFMPEFAAGNDAEFVEDSALQKSSRALVICGWDDVPHIPKDKQAALIANYAPHEIQARTKGIPNIGEGAVYPVPEDNFVIPPIDLPAHWPRVAAFDPGLGTGAALWAAYDRDSDVVYLYSEHYLKNAPIESHAAALKGRGAWIPIVSDDATNVQDGSTYVGKLRNDYGLLIRKAQKHDKEERVMDVYSRLSGGRLKVFKTLTKFLMEFRLYQRDKNGRIVKKNDHLLNCVEMLVQSGLRVARTRVDRDREPIRIQEQTFGIYGVN